MKQLSMAATGPGGFTHAYGGGGGRLVVGTGAGLCQPCFFSVAANYHVDISHALSPFYYSTMMSFYHIWSREHAKYETVIHCSVPV